MSGFIKSLTKTIEYEGDKIAIEYTGLKRKHSVAISDLLLDISNTDGSEMQKLSMRLLNAAIDAGVFEDCVIKFEGLKDGHGNALAISDVVNEQYFIPLLSEIFELIMSGTRVEDEGNSARPVNDTSAGTGQEITAA